MQSSCWKFRSRRRLDGRARALAAGLALAAGAAAPAPAAEPAPAARVLILGDSIMRALSHSLERAFAETPGFEAESFTSLGSGLARLDAFDWLAKISALMQAKKPALVIAMIGTNDRQPMQTKAGVLQPDTEAWSEEYGRRVGGAMDRMIGGGARAVFWIAMPDMPTPQLQAACVLVNSLIRRQAAARPSVTVLDAAAVLSRQPGVYSSYLIDSRGRLVHVRSQDRVHLNRDGADLLAAHIVGEIRKAFPAPAPSGG